METHRFREFKAQGRAESMKGPDCFHEDEVECSRDSLWGCAVAESDGSFAGLTPHWSGGFRIQQGGRRAVASGYLEKRCAVFSPRSLRHIQAVACLRISHVPAFGGDLLESTNRESEIGPKIPGPCGYHNDREHLYAHIKRLGSRCVGRD